MGGRFSNNKYPIMKIGQVIAQLQSVLPNITDLFSEKISVLSITSVGTTATVTTSIAHGLATGDRVNMVGALTPNTITSLTRVGDIGSAVTGTNHDITFRETGSVQSGFQKTVNISGADQAEYNGDKTLLSSDNRRNFTFTVTGDPATPATGTILLNEDLRRSYSGFFPVIVTSPTTFTYVMQSSPPLPAQGIMFLHKGLRISGAITPEQATRSYTEQPTEKLWLFVVPNLSVVSKSRKTLNDAVYTNASGDQVKHDMINNVSVLVYIPLDALESFSGRIEYDLANDVLPLLLKALFGVEFNTTLSVASPLFMSFVEHSILAFRDSYYVHDFKFQMTETLTNDDLVDKPFNIAFRDYVFNLQNAQDVQTSTNLIDLDTVPL